MLSTISLLLEFSESPARMSDSDTLEQAPADKSGRADSELVDDLEPVATPDSSEENVPSGKRKTEGPHQYQHVSITTTTTMSVCVLH